jgi:phosphoglycolate phosphatase-like HAD superfamily hydrolase
LDNKKVIILAAVSEIRFTEFILQMTLMTQTPFKKLVLFDIDGTLLHGGGSGRAATERAMLEVFGTVGALASYRFDGKTDRYTLIHLLGNEGYPREAVEARLPEYETVVARHLTEIIDQYPFRILAGGPELLRTVGDHPLLLSGLITGNLPQMAEIKLRRAGYDPQSFAVKVYGSEGFARRELAPIVLQRATAHSGVQFLDQDVVMLGDTPDDIDCARSIGARIITVATGPFTRAQLETHHPDAIFDDLSDVPAVLEAILV